MSAPSSMLEVNRELARRINQEAKSNSLSPYAGKFVGIANGRVVVADADVDEVIRRLRLAEPDPRKCLCVEASHDYDEVVEIWSQT